MRDDVIFSDFSAFHTNRAAGLEAAGVAKGTVEGQAAGPTRHPGGAAETGEGRLSPPPFSWLGNDAWPDFPR